MFKTILNEETIKNTIEEFKEFFEDMDKEKAIRIITGKIEKEKNTVYEADESWTGKYIMLGGKGLLDGIVSKPSKYDFFKIISVEERGLILKGYRSRTNKVLPVMNFDQKYVLIDEHEYKKISNDYK